MADEPPVADDAAPKRAGAPSWLVWGMIVVASLVAVFSSLGAWVELQVLETENWVEITDDLLENDEIREALSEYIVDELFASVDIADSIDEQLPEPLVGLGQLVGPAIRTAAPNAVDRLLSTQAAAALWTQVNETAHRAFVAVARGDDSPINTVDGVVVLDLGEFVRMLGIDLGLEERFGDALPEDAGELELFESNIIDQVQSAVRIIEVASVLLFIVVVGLYAGAVFLARGWRREALRGVGLALALAGVVVLLLRSTAIDYAVNQVAAGPDVRNAVRAVGVIATDLLDEIAWTGIALAAGIVFYTVLVGPSRVATAARRLLVPLASVPILYWAISLVILLAYLGLTEVAPRQWASIVLVVALWIAGTLLAQREIVRTGRSAAAARSAQVSAAR